MKTHSKSFVYSILIFAISCISLTPFIACSNSESMEYADWGNTVASWDSKDEINSSSSKIEYLPIDDTEYPYAGIPRIVIETENHRAINDRETDIPAKLQIWGEHAPESEIMNLTIRGRGNSSWSAPKKSYKIEFINKQTMLGMPKDRDWALIGNYADKSLMKNYLMYRLSAKLNAFYAPRCEFVELYLNKDYLGIYLLTETIKIGKNRVHVSDNTESYIVEVTENYRKDDQVVFSQELTNDSVGKPFHIHYPKNASEETLTSVKNDIEEFEKHLKTIKAEKNNNIAQWIDTDEFIKHYWIQEFSKNPDADGFSSIYFSFEKGGVIRMGPVWDFDLAFGGHSIESINEPQNWHVKKTFWHSYIFKDSIAEEARLDFWKEKRDIFIETLYVADSVQVLLQNATKNNFNRWKILNSTEYKYHNKAYGSYDATTENLKNWIQERVAWIDRQIRKNTSYAKKDSF